VAGEPLGGTGVRHRGRAQCGGKGGRDPIMPRCAVQCSAEAAWVADRAGAGVRPRRGTPLVLVLPLLHLHLDGGWLLPSMCHV
jgi:hypothetical protein